MNIVFFGTPNFVIPVLESLQNNFKVVTVVTTPDQPTGRKQLLTPSPIKTYAQNHHIPVLTPTKLTQETFSIGHLALPIHEVDLFVVAAYGKIIPQSILDLPKLGALNIHPSLLPKYRGTSPLQYALLNGDQETAISIMKMDAKMDHGPILLNLLLQIQSDDTFETLANKAFTKAAQILPQTINDYVNGQLIPQEQNHEAATYTKIITKQDAYIDLQKLEIGHLAFSIQNMIRAYYPWPTAWTKLQMKNGESKIIKFLPNQKIQLEGKKPTTQKDFFNGYPELKEKIEKLLKE